MRGRQRINDPIPVDGVAVTDGESVDVLNADGSAQLAQGTADVDTTTTPNTFKGVELPANQAIGTDQGSVPIQDGSGNSLGNATFNIAANDFTFVDWAGGGSGTPLENGDPVNFDTADGASIMATGTASVVSGNLVGVLAPATVAVVNDAGSIPLTNDTGSARGSITASVAANVLTTKLPTQTDTVTDAQVKPVLDATGATTLATATAKVPISDFDGLKLDAQYAVTENAGAVTVQNPDGTVGGDATATVQNNVLNFAVLSDAHAIVANDGSVSMTDATGANGKPGAFFVSGGYVPQVRLTAATDALVSNGFSVPIDGSASNGTINIAGSVITSITPIPPLTGGLQDGAAINTKDQTNKTAPGTYDATGNEIDLGQGVVLVGDDDFVDVQNIDGSVSVQGQATVLGGLGNPAEIVLPITWALVQDQQQITIPVDGVNKVVTFTVSGGGIASITTADPA